MNEPAIFPDTRVMVMAAPNGARLTSADHPALPLEPAELAECAEQLLAAGVSVLHLHVRDASGVHTLDVDRYRAAINAIRERVNDNLVLQVTTEAVGRYTAAQQMQLVRDLEPEAVSLALRELCADSSAEQDAASFFAWLQSKRIWPQFILYSADDVRRFDTLRRRGLLATDHPHCLLVLGRYSGELQGEPSELDAMLGAADFAGIPWSVCCFGRNEHAAAMRALALGGHARLGFENNLRLADGSVASDNAALVTQFLTTAAGSGRSAASAAEVRKWLQATN